jgi:hypothetical protein
MPRRALKAVLLVLSIDVLLCDEVAVAQPGWKEHIDDSGQVTFRCPAEWTISQAYRDRVYFEGSTGHVQLLPSSGNTPRETCEGDASHHLKPFGAHPQIRSMKVQRRDACLIWPSQEQGEGADAEVVLPYTRPVEASGERFPQLTVHADKNHILAIIETLKFSVPRASVDNLPAHTIYPIHADETGPLSELIKRLPLPEPPPTRGCKPDLSEFKNSCRVLANGTCPAGYRLTEYCSSSHTEPCRDLCVLEKDAQYLDRLKETCTPFSLNGETRGCMILVSGPCPPNYRLMYLGRGITDSRGVWWGTVCTVNHFQPHNAGK